METEKLYYKDPFLRQFTATVQSCEAGKSGYLVTLDRTAFYPEGGGQPADHGTLAGVAVTDVHEKDGVIFHTCAEKVEIGAAVTGCIDWDRRFDHMQQHSGDCCACCGTHVARAGQVGLVKVLSCQKFREGVRMEIVCGKRARDLLSQTYDQTRAISQKLSVKPRDAAAAVERMAEELGTAKLRAAELEETVFFHIAEKFVDNGDVLLLQPPMKPDSVRRLADAVAGRCGGLAAVFAGPEDGKYHYALIRSDGADIRALVQSMNQTLSGRGGGRNGFAQGSVQADEAAIRAFFHSGC